MNPPRDCFGVQRTVIVLLSLAATGVCHAAPPAPRDGFKENQHRGDNAADDGSLAEAVDGWRAAWDLRPNQPDMACNIGRAELRRNRNRDAAMWLRRCLNLLPNHEDPKSLERHKEVTVELMTAREKISVLTFDIAEPDARVVIDDAAALVTPILEDALVDPGEHHIQAFKGPRTAFTTIATQPGKEYRVALVLPPSLPPAEFYNFAPYVPPPEPVPFRWWPIALGGGVVATGVLVGSVFTGMSGLSTNDAQGWQAQIEADGKSCVTAPIDPRCASYDQAAARSSTYSTAAIVSFIAAGAITAGAIGYAIYENHRVSVQMSATSVSMSAKW